MPNNPRFPVLLYKNALGDRQDIGPNDVEDLFRSNGWEPRWRAGVYGYHHYHSTAHEALGFVGGCACLMLGGPGGSRVDVRPGQVLVLPAGVGHCSVRAEKHFLAVGAYPPGQDWDVCRHAADAAALERIQRLPRPATDPVEGKDGLLLDLWR
ncbi:cupin [Dyella jejuensis]|uniref:Cupin n=2 Tax=Dyella jejuensis TaxID=1432009 RepID=A0ABW8JL63_9GAMM